MTTWNLKTMNEYLARRYAVRLEHAEVEGKCAFDGQDFPCVTIQSMTLPDIMSDHSKGKKKK